MTWELSLISPIYNLIKDSLGWIFKKFKKQDPVQIIAIRHKWKNEFESKLIWIENGVSYGEAIIRDVKRADYYPNTDEKTKGISPWFRVSLLGIYHRGIQVGLRIEAIESNAEFGRWITTSNYDGEQIINAFLVGNIPFESIKNVDWQGDEYYGYPHIYCEFNQRRGREPYESLIFCEKKQTPGFKPFFEELVSYDELRSNDKKYKKYLKKI